MNVYKVSYSAVWVAGEKGPGQTRGVKDGTLCVLAVNGDEAVQIAARNVPNSPDEFHVNHVQELGRNVLGVPVSIAKAVEESI